ncbi:MAG: Zn-dependent hydrolase [Myxococcota bacterium]
MTVADASASQPAALAVDEGRLLHDLEALSSIGRRDEAGIHRLAFSEDDLAGRAWLVDRIEAAGLEARIDGAANLGARWPADDERPPIMTGSHLDTVPGAGWLDGALGVVAGLEVLRVLREHDIALARPVELVAFSDEEGRFGGMLGSQAMSGQLTPEFLERAVDLEGRRLADAMAACGFRALDALRAEREPGSVEAFVELHIEQGPVLESAGRSIGLVDGITGLFRWDARFVGEPNHAGTTPMELRRDAFQALAEASLGIPQVLAEHGSARSRATIGRVQLVPGAANVVPGEALFSLEVRDTDPAVLLALSDAFRRQLAEIARRRRLAFDFETKSELAPVACHDRVQSAIERACRRLEIDPLRMPSGAAHDTQMLARLAPAGMIFVPSRGGRSHSPAEWTSPADLVRGANVLLHTMLELAR